MQLGRLSTANSFILILFSQTENRLGVAAQAVFLWFEAGQSMTKNQQKGFCEKIVKHAKRLKNKINSRGKIDKSDA
ncbi:hypothetical protein DW741_14325 [Ruminococcaceae bacterium AM28-23LB]|nr:hypothetical protein DW741_14325 [Ruminococcaceae bacterium AM28-23LB]